MIHKNESLYLPLLYNIQPYDFRWQHPTSPKSTQFFKLNQSTANKLHLMVQRAHQFFFLHFSSCFFELTYFFVLMIFSGGPYASFAGRDASRALGTFNVNTSDQTDYDDLSDLSAMEMDAIKEWELQFKGEHFFVIIFWNIFFFNKNFISTRLLL